MIRLKLKFSTVIAFLLIFQTISCHGGLLSSLVHRYRNFHYVVQSVPDKEFVPKNSEEMTGGKGTATSSSPFQRIQTHYTDCGSAASIKSLVVSPCANKKKGNSDICEIERGSNVTFNLSFVAKGNATQLKAVIHGIVDYVPIPLPCPEVNFFLNKNINCIFKYSRIYSKLFIFDEVTHKNSTQIFYVIK